MTVDVEAEEAEEELVGVMTRMDIRPRPTICPLREHLTLTLRQPCGDIILVPAPLLVTGGAAILEWLEVTGILQEVAQLELAMAAMVATEATGRLVAIVGVWAAPSQVLMAGELGLELIRERMLMAAHTDQSSMRGPEVTAGCDHKQETWGCMDTTVLLLPMAPIVRRLEPRIQLVQCPVRLSAEDKKWIRWGMAAIGVGPPRVGWNGRIDRTK